MKKLIETELAEAEVANLYLLVLEFKIAVYRGDLDEIEESLVDLRKALSNTMKLYGIGGE